MDQPGYYVEFEPEDAIYGALEEEGPFATKRKAQAAARRLSDQHGIAYVVLREEEDGHLVNVGHIPYGYGVIDRHGIEGRIERDKTMQTAHAINYADPRIKGDGARMAQNEIVRFVKGIRGRRSNPVSARQIKKWLRHTPSDFVDEQITAACADGRICIRQKSLSSGRRFNGAYVYEPA